MTILFLIIPLIVLIVSTYVFNEKLTHADRKVRLLYFSCEVIAVLSIAMIVFLFGYLQSSFHVIILLTLTFFSLVGLYGFTLLYNDHYYDQLSVVWNALLFFLKTVVSFLVFMTIFRYTPLWIQITLSIIGSASIFGVSLFLEPYIVRKTNSIVKTLSDFDRYEFIAVPLLVILALSFLINTPHQTISQALNVNNHIRFLVFDTDIPSDINVNFEQEFVDQYVIDDMSVFARDFYMDDDYVYVYLNDEEKSALISGRFLIIDRTTQEIVYNELTMNQPSTGITSEAYNSSESQQHFIEYNDSLLLFASDGLYTVDKTTVQKISDIAFVESEYYVEDGNLYFLVQQANRVYDQYIFSNNDLTLVDTLDFNTGDIINIQVVNEHLIYYNRDGYYYQTPSTPYDPDDAAYLADGDGDYIYHFNTIYEPSTNLFYQFSYEDTHHQVLRIYQEDGTLFGYFVHNSLHTWFVLNSYHIDTDLEYRIQNDQLQFMLVSNRQNTTTLTFYNMNYEESSYAFPFYAHYSLTTIWFIIIAVFIPYFNNEKFYTYVDYASVLQKKEDEVK